MAMSPELAAKVLASRKQELTVVMTPDTYPWYRNMHAQRIVYDERRAAWMVFRYADVRASASRHGQFFFAENPDPPVPRP